MNTKKNWADIQKNIEFHDRRWLLFMAVLFCAGVTQDALTKLDRTMLYVPTYAELCLTVLSIQAAVGTLVFTILSLLTGKMGQSAYGISEIDFLLNIKPRFFKQKTIIVAELVLVCLGVGLQIFSCFNTIIACFLIALLLVGISIFEIYEVFSGTENVRSEISAYLQWEMESTDSVRKESIQSVKNFCEQWKKEILDQSENEYKDYLEKFDGVFKYTYLENDSRLVLLDSCAKIASTILNGGNSFQRIRGIDFVQTCYRTAEKYGKSAGLCITPENQFDLITRVQYDFMQAVNQCDIAALEKTIQWDAFVKSIVANTISVCDEKNISAFTDLRGATDLSFYFGKYYIQNENRANSEKWGNILQRPLIETEEFQTAELNRYAMKVVSECYFRFMIAMIWAGAYDLVKKTWYKSFENEYYYNEFYVYVTLKLQCFIYYLTYYETEEFVDKSILDKARNFIEALDVEKEFGDFIDTSIRHDENVCKELAEMMKSIDVYNSELSTRLYEDLRQYEFSTARYKAKELCMMDVTMDFVTYLACYIETISFSHGFLNKVITEENATAYYLRYHHKDKSVVVNDLCRFFALLGLDHKRYEEKTGDVRTAESTGDASKIEVLALSEAMKKARTAYEKLVSVIEEKYKLYILHEAECATRLQDSDYDAQIKNAEDKINSNLKGILGKLMNPSIAGQNIDTVTADGFRILKAETVRVYRISTFADENIENIITDFIDDIYPNVVTTIAVWMLNQRYIDKIDVAKMDEEEWHSFIDAHSNKMIIGSSSLLRYKNLHDTEKAEKWLKDSETYTNSNNGVAMVLDPSCLEVYIDHIQVTVRPETLEDVLTPDILSSKNDSEKIPYAPSRDMPVNFTKDELKQYLENKRRIVDINMDIKIAVKQEDAKTLGVVLYDGSEH